METELHEGWLDDLSGFLAIPSVSAEPSRAGDVTRAAEWVAARVRRLGGEAEVGEGGRIVVGEIAGPPGAPVVLAYGHYDVQPPDPLELWESDPFSAEVRGEWLYARGVADDKGQLWMQLEAIESLLAEGPLPVGFRVVCDGEEETGGDAIIRFLAADRAPVDACVILDGWMKRRNRPELVVATRGLVALDVEVRTGDRDLHSGHYGGRRSTRSTRSRRPSPGCCPATAGCRRRSGSASRPRATRSSRAGASCHPARRSSPGSARCRSTPPPPTSSTSAPSSSPRST